jgi:hypothetical protein
MPSERPVTDSKLFVKLGIAVNIFAFESIYDARSLDFERKLSRLASIGCARAPQTAFLAPAATRGVPGTVEFALQSAKG